MLKRLFLTLTVMLALTAGSAMAADTAPKTVIHVISVQWTKDATQAQIDKVIDFVKTMPAKNPDILHVWVRPIKKQLPEGYGHIMVMEFSSEEALKKYVDSPAQKGFYQLYMPIRAESRTSDITN